MLRHQHHYWFWLSGFCLVAGLTAFWSDDVAVVDAAAEPAPAPEKISAVRYRRESLEQPPAEPLPSSDASPKVVASRRPVSGTLKLLPGEIPLARSPLSGAIRADAVKTADSVSLLEAPAPQRDRFVCASFEDGEAVPEFPRLSGTIETLD